MHKTIVPQQSMNAQPVLEQWKPHPGQFPHYYSSHDAVCYGIALWPV